MRVSELKNSRFLTPDDCEPAIVVTISHAERQNVAPPDAEPDDKYCLHFKEENVKPHVLNVTNGKMIEKLLGSDNSVDWTGKQVVLYRDDSVQFGGNFVGGIRVRAYEAPNADGLDQDIPF